MIFWETIWAIVFFFVLVSYLILLFQIVGDLFRNRDQSGLAKALWVFFLLVFPVFAALVHLIIHGDDMADRANCRRQDPLGRRRHRRDRICSIEGKSTQLISRLTANREFTEHSGQGCYQLKKPCPDLRPSSPRATLSRKICGGSKRGPTVAARYSAMPKRTSRPTTSVVRNGPIGCL